MTPARPLADVFPAYVTIATPPAVLYDPTTNLPVPIRSTTPPTSLPPGSAHYDKARVIVYNGGAFVFVDSTTRPGTAERVLALPLAPPPNHIPSGVATRTSDATITTANGTTLAWSRNPGCGCGSRLRSFNPYSDGRTLALP